MTLIYFILVLCVTICIHEFGHFIFAKKSGVYVYEFSLGMGPRLFKFNRKNDETDYSIRLFPIGGYVSMAGEDDLLDKKIPSEMQMFNKKWSSRFMIISAGVLFNFILAIFLLFIVGLKNGVSQNKPFVGNVEVGLSAYNEGMVKDDRIIKVDNVSVKNVDQLSLEMQVHNGKKIKFTVIHPDGNIENIIVNPQKIEVNDKINYSYGFGIDSSKSKGLFVSIKYAFRKTASLFNQMWRILKYLITGKLSFDNLSGPVGIYSIVGDAAKNGFINIIFLTAYLCINVGIINFIPLPAFDGGRALFLIIEKIKGSRINPKIENVIHTIGFMMLMVLMVCITFNDLVRLFM